MVTGSNQESCLPSWRFPEDLPSAWSWELLHATHKCRHRATASAFLAVSSLTPSSRELMIKASVLLMGLPSTLSLFRSENVAKIGSGEIFVLVILSYHFPSSILLCCFLILVFDLGLPCPQGNSRSCVAERTEHAILKGSVPFWIFYTYSMLSVFQELGRLWVQLRGCNYWVVRPKLQ